MDRYNDRMWQRLNTFYKNIPADRASRGYKGEPTGAIQFSEQIGLFFLQIRPKYLG